MFGGANFLGVQIQGSNISRTMKMLVFAVIIVVVTFSGSGVIFSRCGQNSLGGINTIQFLCISIPDTVTRDP